VWQGIRGKLSEGNDMADQERRDGRTVIKKARRRGMLPRDLKVAGDPDQDAIKTNELQPAELLGEDFAREAPPEAAVSQKAIDLGNKRTQEVIGPEREGVKKFCIQHGPKATRPGQVATVITDKATEYDPKTMNREPCHVLRYENGALAYLPMSVPGCALGKKPSFLLRRKYGRWAEWCYETDSNGVSITHVARLIKGRAVEKS
jgi:hypothetical protein